MVIDSTFFLQNLVTSLEDNIDSVVGGEILVDALDDGFLTTLNNTDINQYAMEIDGVLTDREEYYFGTLDEINRKMINVQNGMNLKMDVVSTTPVKESLSGLYFIGLFLQSTFATIVFFMLLLSMMLIYSLMISDVDEKTYDMGMLRALGLRTASLMQLVIIQSLLFSIPGVIIGVAISAIANVGLRLFIFIYSVATYTFLFSAASTIFG
jgi:ABC-type antimicrobial peptide transport system permease subunit